MFVCGGLASCAMFFNLLNPPPWLETTLSFISMIGGGVLCSALVTLIIEIQNDNRDKKRCEEQRLLLLADVKYRLFDIYKKEAKVLSWYYNKHVLNEQYTYVEHDISCKELVVFLSLLTDKLYKEEQKNASYDFDNPREVVKKSKDKKACLVTHTQNSYNYLLTSLNKLSNEFPLLVTCGILNEDSIKALKHMSLTIEYILSYTNPAHYEIEFALFEKKYFFDEAEQYLQVLNISNQETINCFFKDVL